ncbi:MAG TPA: hypothetical protein VN380_10680 [Thermoanaerobaculia bacterium]|jgi:hypothetical protein|nr:hypothetical protein [Thermoanaerobaculia bacterium]
MASHEVKFTIPQCSLGHADVEFEVSRNGSFFGTLKVSNGAIVWEPAHAKKYEYKVSWTKFDEFAQANGRSISR